MQQTRRTFIAAIANSTAAVAVLPLLPLDSEAIWYATHCRSCGQLFEANERFQASRGADGETRKGICWFCACHGPHIKFMKDVGPMLS